jgi:putative glutamine amidotransferase
MRHPIIGLTCFAMQAPPMHPNVRPGLRSAVNQDYVDAIVAAGGSPIGIPLGLGSDALRRIYQLLDGLLLPGGDDVAPRRYGQDPHASLGLVDEARDELEITVADWALADDLPLLGICRGIQVLAVAAGGTLYQDVPSQLGSTTLHDVREFGRDHLCHDIDITPGSMLARALGRTHVDVNSFHHQAVLDVPAGFVVNARACDDLIEGIEAPGKSFAVGVQCHPEGIWRTTAPEFGGLFRAFVEAAGAHAEERAASAATAR